MPADLIVYALIAAGLVFWLRSILGTRHGEERDRSNPYLANSDNPDMPALDNKIQNGEALIAELAQNAKGNMAIEGRTAELGLIEITKNDRSFDIYAFLQAAQDAFVYIVESFADGDRETLKDLLSAQVYDAFDAAITARANSGEVLSTEIHSIKKAEVVGARVDGRMGMVTVRFIAEETSVTKDREGNIIHGHPEKVSQMRDVWSFARDLRGRDPRWLLVETREDAQGDNQIIPNTH